MTDLQVACRGCSFSRSPGRSSLLWILVALSILTSGCSTYSSKFRTVVAKIKQDEFFHSLDATLRYELQGGDSEAIPYRAVVYLEYVDAETNKKVVHRCLYQYTLTWEQGESRDWNWQLAAVHQQSPSGEWILSREAVVQPGFLKMLRP